MERLFTTRRDETRRDEDPGVNNGRLSSSMVKRVDLIMRQLDSGVYAFNMNKWT